MCKSFFILIILFCLSNHAVAYSVFIYKVKEPELSLFAINQDQARQNRYKLLKKLVNEIEGGYVSNIHEFTTITLNIMAELYEEAADSYASESRSMIEKPGKSYRWYHATLNYARDLRNKAELINDESEIEISSGSNGELLILIDNTPYLVTGPSIKQEDRNILEQRIVNFLCQINYCPVELYEEAEEINTRTITIHADWVIGEERLPAFVTREGLHIVFKDIKKRSRKQTLCLELITDIMLVTEILREIASKGIRVELNQLKLEPVAGSKDYKLTFNEFNDAVLISLSRFADADISLQAIRTWLSAQIENSEDTLFLDGDSVFKTMM